MPKISVILCAYNAADTLSAAARSVLSQTERDLELIIVNDGSTDSTSAEAARLALFDRRVKVIDRENGGLSRARNIGIAAAGGEYIAFCDADDTVDDKALQTMLNKAEDTGSDMVICGYHHDTVKSDGSVSTVDFFEPENRFTSKTELFGALIGLKSKFILDAGWNKLYRADIIKENGLKMPEGELFEDTAFVLSFLNVSCRVSVLPHCFYHYVQRGGKSITKSYDKRKLEDLKKRYLALKGFTAEADDGVKRFCELYYVKNVYSVLANTFGDRSMKAKQRRSLFKTEIKNADFKRSAENARGEGAVDRLTLAVARTGSVFLSLCFCRVLCFLKTKAAALFAKIKN